MKRGKRLSSGSELRRKALQRMDHNPENAGQELLYELQVRQIELEIQNEELRCVQDDLDAALLRYTNLFEFAPIGYFTLDKNSRIEEVNLTGADLLSQPRAHLIDASFTSFVRPDDLLLFLRFMQATLETDVKQTCEVQLRKEDGSVWVHIEAGRSRTGGMDAVLLGVIDITIRKHMEARLRTEAEDLALREARRHLKLILDNIPDKAWLKDCEGRYVVVNDAFTKDTGSTPDIVTGKTLFDIFPKDIAEKWHAHDQEVLLSGQRMFFEEIIVDKEGRNTWFETARTPVYDAEGVITGTVGIARDVTRQKEAEEQIRIASDDLRSLTLELNLAEERERRRIAMELHDNVSQNLAYCKIKLKELELGLGLDSRSLGHPITEVSATIGQIIQNVRTLTFELSPPVLYELGLEAAIDWLAEHMLLSRGICYQFEHPDHDYALNLKLQITLFQIVRELLTNTVKHAQATAVHVVLRVTGRSIMISVQDNGAGFDVPDFIKRKPNSLGMFSIRERLRHLGGFLSMQSQPGCGAKATIEVPVF